MAESDSSSNISADEGFSEESYAESTTTSYATSIASEIRRGVEENGRTYPAYGKNIQALPVDEREQDRNDLQHCKFMLLLGGKLHLAPIAETPHKILDLGTGSGIWAIDMADKYPSAQVTGVDLAAIQPSWVPPNCRFEIEDVEEDWLFAKNSFDFIHAREFLCAIRDWDKLITQSFDHLKPGGYAEVSGTLVRLGSDDNTIPAQGAWVETTKIFHDIGDKMGASISAPTTWKGIMERVGFLDVKETIFKIPSGAWPKDRRLKQIGAIEFTNLNEGYEAFMMRGYTTILGGSREEMQVLLAEARSEMRNPRIHAYVYL